MPQVSRVEFQQLEACHTCSTNSFSECLLTFLVKASLNVSEKVRTDDASPDVSLQVRGGSLPQLSAGIRSIISKKLCLESLRG